KVPIKRSKRTAYQISEPEKYTPHVPNSPKVAFGVRVRVPRTGAYGEACSFLLRRSILSRPVNDPNCYVMCFPRHKQCVMLCKVGDVEWVEQDLIFPPDDFVYLSCVSTYDGQIHMLRSCKLFLVEIENYHVTCTDLQIMKLDSENKNWVSVQNLKDRAVFINLYDGPIASFSTKEFSGLKENTINFTAPKDRFLYRYNLKEKRVAICMPCPNVTQNWLQPM
ncbi:hypothetical protein Tsubulata_044176, partial [Turnera subulata]